MNNKSLPRSNHSPAACSPTSGDRIGGIPDMVQRPARKGYDCEDIGPGMKCSDKGYKIVDVKAVKDGETETTAVIAVDLDLKGVDLDLAGHDLISHLGTELGQGVDGLTNLRLDQAAQLH